MSGYRYDPKNLLCVGGPRDGAIVPYAGKRTILRGGLGGPTEYVERVFNTGEGEKFFLYAPESWTYADIIRALLKGYRP